MKNYLILILVFLNFSFISLASIKKPVVATVNGQPIYLEDFEQTYKQNVLYLSSNEISKKKVLYDLINREIGIQRAKKIKLYDDPTVKTKMEDVLYHAYVSKELESQLKQITVKDQEIEKYYKDYPEYRTAQILLRLRVEATEKEKDEQLTQALKIYNEVKDSPSKFHELANKYSEIATAQNGGDVGFQQAVRMPQPYFQAIHNKPINFISKPIKTHFGFHIVKLLGKRNYDQIDKNLYQKIIYDIKRDNIIANYFANVRKDATIVISDPSLK